MTPEEDDFATKIAAHELQIALVDLLAATGAGNAAVAPELLGADVDMRTARAAFDEAAATYTRRSAMLLSIDPDGAAFLLKLEQRIAARLRAFLDSPEGRGSNQILGAAAKKLHPVLLSARGVPLPAQQQ